MEAALASIWADSPCLSGPHKNNTSTQPEFNQATNEYKEPINTTRLPQEYNPQQISAFILQKINFSENYSQSK